MNEILQPWQLLLAILSGWIPYSQKTEPRSKRLNDRDLTTTAFADVSGSPNRNVPDKILVPNFRRVATGIYGELLISQESLD